MKEYIEREALLKGIDEFYHTSHIQSLTRETEEAKTLWNGIHSGVNYCRNHILEVPAEKVAPIHYAYWDYQNDGTHFCSECGCDAPCNRDYKEVCSTWCPTCGAFMTEVRDND